MKGEPMTEALSHFINGAGWLAPLYYVGSFVLTALVPVIPTPLVGALGGKAFGFLAAVAYGLFGLALGALVGLFLARRLGRPVLFLMVRPQTWAEWEELLGIRSVAVWGVLFFVLNLDFVVLLSGLSALPLWELWVAAMIARTPWLIASAWFGSAVLVSDAVMWIMLILMIPALIAFNRLRPRLRHWLVRLGLGGRPRGGPQPTAAPPPDAGPAPAAPEEPLRPGASSRDS